ncbi:MAG: hypothetical protein M3P48_00980 [Actinomycetota bacterium]|nr:hypothetical protein [Actinomycetota bacterium]
MTPTRTVRRAATLLALLLAALALPSLTATPAYASCAEKPRRSPYAFPGTVIDTARGGLVATVVTDDGRKVTVVGTPAESGVSTVDRTYALGARYEFHPLNSASPLQDNICTRTTRISGPAETPAAIAEPVALDVLPDALPVDEDSVAVGRLLLGAALALVVGGGAVAWRRGRRGALRTAA